MVLSVVFCCVMLCHVVLYCVVMFCCVILCCVVFVVSCCVVSCFVLYCVVLCHFVSCPVVLCCCAVLCCVVLCCVVPCHVILCHVVLCCVVLCCVVLCCVACHNINSALFQWLYEDDLLQCPMRGNSMITPARATVMADLRKVHQSTYLLPLSISTQPFMKLSLVRYLANSFMWSVYDKDHMSELRIPLEPQNFFWALFVTA